MKIHLLPDKRYADEQTGIGQIILAQYKYFPQMGMEIVSDIEHADISMCHIEKGDLKQIDILQLHGMYFKDIPHYPYADWHHSINKMISESVRRALTILVPSSWTAEVLKRDMRLSDTTTPRLCVLGHGVDLDEWKTSANLGYILYNKNRESDVCSSLYAYKLAELGFPIVSSYMPIGNYDNLPNFRVVGVVPHDKIKKIIQSANIYLSTTLETFGIGTLEALASGVPVLGFDWGGNRDLVQHGVNGYLVKPYDVDGLKAGVEYINSHRDELSKNAIAISRKYDWKEIIKKYREIIEETHARKLDIEKNGKKVTFVISNYNYGKWVCDAVDSVLNQSSPVEEVIVVDDGSTDDSLVKLKKYKDNKKVRVIAQNNQGVASARNNGIKEAKTHLIVNLDADDMVERSFIATLTAAFDDRGLGVAYSGLAMCREDGTGRHITGWPPDFSWEIQTNVTNPPSNTIPSCSMFRKEMWRRCGGYKQMFAPAEDTEFWNRGLSVGFTAKRVTPDALFIYRGHEGSASRTKKYNPLVVSPWMTDKIFPFASPSKKIPVVFSYSLPSVSIIIPVGKGHAKHIPSVIECVLNQSYRLWELIVIDDTWDDDGKSELDNIKNRLEPFPFAKIVKSDKHGAGSARNKGLDIAKSPCVMFLDADDYLMGSAVSDMIEAFLEQNGYYVYTDYYIREGNELSKNSSLDYDQGSWINFRKEFDETITPPKMQHSMMVIMDTEQAKSLRFDEEMEAWEDWDFFIRAAIRGYCGYHLNKPLFVYNLETGMRRISVVDDNGSANEKGAKILKKMYSKINKNGGEMASCCGGSSGADSILKAKNLVSNTSNIGGSPMTRLEFIGKNMGDKTFTVHGRSYRAGRNPTSRYINAQPEDVEHLVNTGQFIVIREASTTGVVQNTQKQALEPIDINALAIASLEQAKKDAMKIDFDSIEIPVVEEQPIKETPAINPVEETPKRELPRVILPDDDFQDEQPSNLRKLLSDDSDDEVVNTQKKKGKRSKE